MEYVSAKTIITKTKGSQWFGIDYNMNIYRGCCHGRIYCDSRSDCYRIDDFDRVSTWPHAMGRLTEMLMNVAVRGQQLCGRSLHVSVKNMGFFIK